MDPSPSCIYMLMTLLLVRGHIEFVYSAFKALHVSWVRTGIQWQSGDQFQVVTTAVMNSFVLWDITPCSSSKDNADFQRNTEKFWILCTLWLRSQPSNGFFCFPTTWLQVQRPIMWPPRIFTFHHRTRCIRPDKIIRGSWKVITSHKTEVVVYLKVLWILDTEKTRRPAVRAVCNPPWFITGTSQIQNHSFYNLSSNWTVLYSKPRWYSP